MVQGEQSDGNDVFQLAVNKAGTIRGNYYNVLSDITQPVYGSVDKKTQRAAWTVGDRKEPVYEVGFANLTKSETTMMVHFGKELTAVDAGADRYRPRRRSEQAASGLPAGVEVRGGADGYGFRDSRFSNRPRNCVRKTHPRRPFRPISR